MNSFVYIAMFGWPVISFFLFAIMPSTRSAVLLSVYGGWLLLPQASFSFSGLPDYTRFLACMLGIVLGVLMFDSNRLSKFRLKWLDLPIIIMCTSPLASSLTNGLGFYDGISAVFTATFKYGVPYLIGRLYMGDQRGMKHLAVGLVLSVLCYSLLILYELRMSPQLHKNIYGYSQIRFTSVWRFGWYRPVVFLHHGLELGILVAAGAITAFWLWRSRAVKRFGMLPAGFSALTLLVICAFCRALNGYVALIMGLGTLYFTKMFKVRTIAILLVMLPAIYIFGRVLSNWNAVPVVKAIESIDKDRARSFNSRISHEITLIDKALIRPYFGWGGYNRNRADRLAAGARGKRSITDSFWIIVLGKYGLVGLISAGFVLLRPVILLIRRLPLEKWGEHENAPAVALSMVLFVFTIDCLANSMISPIYFIISGALMAYNPVLEDKEHNS